MRVGSGRFLRWKSLIYKGFPEFQFQNFIPFLPVFLAFSQRTENSWDIRRAIEEVITRTTRNRNRFVERSTRKSLDLCRFSRVRKRKNLWVLPISSPHFPKRIGWRYNLEGCPSGRRCDSRKVVCRKAPRVRIPNPPPQKYGSNDTNCYRTF